MNIVRTLLKPTMILTILLAISCGIQPLTNKGSDFKSTNAFVSPQVMSVRQDTPTVHPPKALTPAQIEMTRRINKAFLIVPNKV